MMIDSGAPSTSHALGSASAWIAATSGTLHTLEGNSGLSEHFCYTVVVTVHATTHAQLHQVSRAHAAQALEPQVSLPLHGRT